MQFLLHWKVELDRQHLENTVYTEVITLMVASMLTLALPLSVFLASGIYYKYRLSEQPQTIRLKSGVIPALLLSILGFIWINEADPLANIHLASLLFDISSKRVEEPVKKTSISLFADFPSYCNYRQLNALLDSSVKRRAMVKHRTAEQIIRYGNSASIRKILRDPDIRSLGLSEKDLIKEKNPDDGKGSSDTNTYKVLKIILCDGLNSLDAEDRTGNSCQLRKAQIIVFPVMISFLFYFGMFAGSLYRKYHPVFLFLSTYLILASLIYFPKQYLEKKAGEMQISPFVAELLFVVELGIIGIGLFLYSKRHLYRDRGTLPGIEE